VPNEAGSVLPWLGTEPNSTALLGLVYPTPEVDGYRDLAPVGHDGRLSPLAFPDLTLSVADLFA